MSVSPGLHNVHGHLLNMPAAPLCCNQPVKGGHLEADSILLPVLRHLTAMHIAYIMTSPAKRGRFL